MVYIITVNSARNKRRFVGIGNFYLNKRNIVTCNIVISGVFCIFTTFRLIGMSKGVKHSDMLAYILRLLKVIAFITAFSSPVFDEWL